MPFGASSPRHQKQGTSTLDEHGHEAASCASKAGCRAFIARQWFNALLSIACAVCFTVAKIKDPEPVPGVWLAAAITGALPAARLVVWLAEHLLRLDPFEMLLWYATPVLRHAVPCTWATVVMATLRRNPTDDELLQLVMLSCCWLLIGWSLARTLIHMGLQFLRHVLTLNHAPANQAKQRRALQILAYLYTCAKQGTGAPPAASILTMSGAKAQSSHPSLSDIFGDMPSGTGSSTSTGATRASTTPINEEQDTFTGIGVTVETSYAPSASPTFNSSAIPEAKPGRPQQRTPMVTAASAPTLHKRSGSGGATTSARAPAATTAAAVAAPGTSSLGRNDKSAALLAGAATAAAAAASAQTLSVDWLPHTQFSRRFKWAKRPKLAPVVADQAQLELLLGLLEDNDKRQKCMRSLYEYIRSMRHGKLVVSSVSLQKVLAPPDASLLVSQLGLFRRVLTRDEFAKAVVALQSRYNRSTGSTSTGHVTWTLRILADVFLAALLPIGFLLLMHVDPISILVPVMSGFVALSFVFAPSVQQFVTCLVFVLILHPFDVGDVVVIENEPYRVDKITVLKTSLMAILSNARVYMPNTKLAKITIENGQRSNHAVIQVDIHVDPWITAMQVKELQNRVKTYMREESKDDWLQPADPYIIAMDVRPEDGKLNLKVFGSTWVAWSARSAVLTVRSGLTLACTRALSDMGVSHERPPTRLLVAQDQRSHRVGDGEGFLGVGRGSSAPSGLRQRAVVTQGGAGTRGENGVGSAPPAQPPT